MGSQVLPNELKDQGNTLFNTLGSFWAQFYQGQEPIEDLMRGRQQNRLETLNDLRELAASVSRFQIPVYHCERWFPLALQQSTGTIGSLVYSDISDDLGPVPETILNTQTHVYPIPTDFKNAATASDVITNPNVIWTAGVDYVIDPATATITFRSDPFTAGFQVSPIHGEGNVVTDQTVTLWFNCADIDQQFVSTQFGSVLRLMLPSGQNYKDLVNGVWDADLLGSNRAALDQILSAVCDAPITTTDGETVQFVQKETDRVWVATDQNVYIGGAGATAVVSVGDVLNGGTPLFDAFRIIELSQGTPVQDALPYLVLTTDYLRGSFVGGLKFFNQLVPLVVTTVSGRTKVSFYLEGDAGDITLFWDTIHTNGIAPGKKTLAQLLDLRPQPQSTDPDATSLPQYINPLAFLIDNVLRGGMTVAMTNTTSFGPRALTADILSVAVRSASGPQGAVLLMPSPPPSF